MRAAAAATAQAARAAGHARGPSWSPVTITTTTITTTLLLAAVLLAMPAPAAAAAAAAGQAGAAPAAHPGAPRLAAANATRSSGLLTHNGRQLFLVGVNLGNVHFLPFALNPYGLSPGHMRATLLAAFDEMAAAGANSVRLWLHIDGSISPAWGKDQHWRPVVAGLPPGLIDDVRWTLAEAHDRGLLVCISLWSHDILAVRRLNPRANRERAVLMMTDDAATDAYISNALTPLLAALAAPMRPGGAGGAGGAAPRFLDAVLSWEVLNEPEGISRHWRLYKNYMYAMAWGNYSWWNPASFLVLASRSAAARLTPSGGQYTGYYFLEEDGSFNRYSYHDIIDNYPSEWDFLKREIVDARALATVEVPHTRVLRFINRVAGAIHRAAPGSLVTTGVHSIPYASSTPMTLLNYSGAPHDYYSDASLLALGGDPHGTLDLLQVHAYPLWDQPVRDASSNLFRWPKAHWGTSKPILLGEHWEQVAPQAGTKVTPSDYEHLHDAGYAGAWGWAWFNITETFDLASGAATRRISEHKCRGTLLALLAGLPARLRYPVRAQQQQLPAPAPAAATALRPAGAATAGAAAPADVVFG